MNMTIEQFSEWAATAQFARTADYGSAETQHAPHEYSDQPSNGCAPAWVELSAALPDSTKFQITAAYWVIWDGDSDERVSDEIDVSEYEDGDGPFTLQGPLCIVDEDGAALPRQEQIGMVRDALPEVARAMLEIDGEAVAPKLLTTDIDIDEESGMETITIENDGAPNIRITGQLLVCTSSSANNASSYYSGSVGRWTELNLYKTAGGRFVAQSIGHTQWQGEHTRYKAAVCQTEADVIEFFGHGWLAKNLYEDAGIADVQEVD